MIQQTLLDSSELPLTLRKLADWEIEALGIKHFGNLYYYYPDQIKALVLDVHKKYQRNK
jgi:hypothetical protein